MFTNSRGQIGILIVEKDRGLGRTIKRLLEDWCKRQVHQPEIEITLRETDEEGLAAATTKNMAGIPFDVAILGTPLPRVDGLYLFSDLQSLQPNAFTIILGGDASIRTVVEKFGAKFIEKPFRTADLESLFAQAVI